MTIFREAHRRSSTAESAARCVALKRVIDRRFKVGVGDLSRRGKPDYGACQHLARDVRWDGSRSVGLSIQDPLHDCFPRIIQLQLDGVNFPSSFDSNSISKPAFDRASFVPFPAWQDFQNF